MPIAAITYRGWEIIDLPPLNGSPRQVEWAQAIRGRFAYTGADDLHTAIARIDRRSPGTLPTDWPDQLATRLIPVFANPDAKWWIEHRYDLPRFWIGWLDSADLAVTIFGAAMRGGD
ncbi:hypothetical protein [Sphingomonas sp. 3-13AW]|uniref:hypothetical protein n=1 Tax=Sphingomonas sp. 3-13AW TaxID=3050450 RepID=UPI003BB7F489